MITGNVSGRSLKTDTFVSLRKKTLSLASDLATALSKMKIMAQGGRESERVASFYFDVALLNVCCRLKEINNAETSEIRLAQIHHELSAAIESLQDPRKSAMDHVDFKLFLDQEITLGKKSKLVGRVFFNELLAPESSLILNIADNPDGPIPIELRQPSSGKARVGQFSIDEKNGNTPKISISLDGTQTSKHPWNLFMWLLHSANKDFNAVREKAGEFLSVMGTANGLMAEQMENPSAYRFDLRTVEREGKVGLQLASRLTVSLGESKMEIAFLTPENQVWQMITTSDGRKVTDELKGCAFVVEDRLPKGLVLVPSSFSMPAGMEYSHN